MLTNFKLCEGPFEVPMNVQPPMSASTCPGCCRCGGQESGGASTSSGDTWALGSSCEGWSQSLPSCQDQETGGQGAGQGAEHAGAVLPHCARAAAVR